MSLRAEVFDEDKDGLQPETWRGAVWKWRDWYKDSRDSRAVFENVDGDRVKGSDPNRFHPDYGDKQYAKLKDLERGIKADYGRRLHTAMLTLTASSRPGGKGTEPIPPVDHLNGLLASWEAVTRELRRCMEGKRYERLAILEPHPGEGANRGYLHVHIAVFVDGVVSREDFAPVIQAHLRNCDIAGEEAHDVTDDRTISVRWAGGERDPDGEHLDELAIYLAEYLGTYGEDPLESPEHVQMANAVMWATGRQRWRPSNGAQEYMKTENSEPSGEWELVGIEDGAGDLHECGDGFGGVTKLETFTPTDRWGAIRAQDRPPD